MEEKKERIYTILGNEMNLHDISSVVDLVDSMILFSMQRNASDIHIDPTSDGIIVKFRVDWVLRYVDTLKEYLHEEIIARIKVLSGLRTDIHFVPQDGRFRFKKNNCDCDVRVSIIPTHYGENSVIRLLRNETEVPTLGTLGFSEEDISRIVSCLSYHQGMILVTGPTGSGKTSTLYTLISSLASENNSIITLEDPIEYAIQGVRQVQIQSKHGITFANGLRSIVRQDPDIIMVGEIRDTETAQIATNISLTGHLLLSTLHTNSALGAIPRLIDMKVDPYLVASTISLVIAQRLVRRVCKNCDGAGCGVCGDSGYLGRIVISETLVVDEELRKYIMVRSSPDEIYRYARAKGMKTMFEDGIQKVEQGLTTKSEISRVLHD